MTEEFESELSFAQWAIGALDSPDILWDVAFESHLSPHQQALLVVLTTMPSTVEVSVLEAAWRRYCEVIGLQMKVGEFQRALAPLEGSFVRVTRDGFDRMCSFRDASVTDFMVSLLDANPGEIDTLADSISYFEQIQVLCSMAQGTGWSVRFGKRTRRSGIARGIADASVRLSLRAQDLYTADSIERWSSWRSRGIQLAPIEKRMTFLLRERDRLFVATDWIESQLALIVERWSDGKGDRADAVAMEAAIDRLPDVDVDIKATLKNSLLEWLVDDPIDMDDWTSLLDFVLDRFGPSDRSTVISEFHDFVVAELEDWPPRDLYRLDEYTQLVGLDDLYEDLEEALRREHDEELEAGAGINPSVDPDSDSSPDASDEEIDLLFADMRRKAFDI